MYILKDRQKLYLSSWEYNAALILKELCSIIENNGGRVKPEKNTALIVNRSLHGEILETECRLEKLRKAEETQKPNPARAKVISVLENKLTELKSIPEREPVEANHLTYIRFVLDGFCYYYQMDENPFFDFYYEKTPVKNGAYSRNACLDIDKNKNEWLFDCFFDRDCSDENIKEAANIIFNMLVNSQPSVIRLDGKKRRVQNTYNSGYHYETIFEKEKFETIDF